MKEKMMRLLSKKLIIGLMAGVAVIGVTAVIVVAMVSVSPWKRVKDSVFCRETFRKRSIHT